MSRSLVLSSGGPGGTAWLLGFIHGSLAAGVDLGEADRVIGTSAGALAGAALRCGTLDEAVQTYRRSGLPRIEYPATLAEFAAAAMRASAGVSDRAERVRRIANLAPLGSHLVSPGVMRRVVQAHVPANAWPDRRLEVTAVDAETGRRSMFDAGSGIELSDAIAASCTGPGLGELVTINGRRYGDGGLHSPFNLDLAAGDDIVVLLIPLPNPHFEAMLEEERASLGCAAVHVIAADGDSQAAIGPNPLSFETLPAALDAGLAQAGRDADELRSFWDPTGSRSAPASP